MLPNHLERLDSIRDAVLAHLVHVHSRRNAFPVLFQDPILEHERGDASFLKPTRDLVPFQIDRQRNESARSDDDADPVALALSGGKPSMSE